MKDNNFKKQKDQFTFKGVSSEKELLEAELGAAMKAGDITQHMLELSLKVIEQTEHIDNDKKDLIQKLLTDDDMPGALIKTSVAVVNQLYNKDFIPDDVFKALPDIPQEQLDRAVWYLKSEDYLSGKYDDTGIYRYYWIYSKEGDKD